jgi:hypothetical protein
MPGLLGALGRGFRMEAAGAVGARARFFSLPVQDLAQLVRGLL